MSSCLNSRTERFRMASHPALGMSVSVRGAGSGRAEVSFLPLEAAGRAIITSVRRPVAAQTTSPRYRFKPVSMGSHGAPLRTVIPAGTAAGCQPGTMQAGSEDPDAGRRVSATGRTHLLVSLGAG